MSALLTFTANQSKQERGCSELFSASVISFEYQACYVWENATSILTFLEPVNWSHLTPCQLGVKPKECNANIGHLSPMREILGQGNQESLGSIWTLSMEGHTPGSQGEACMLIYILNSYTMDWKQHLSFHLSDRSWFVDKTQQRTPYFSPPFEVLLCI